MKVEIVSKSMTKEDVVKVLTALNTVKDARTRAVVIAEEQNENVELWEVFYMRELSENIHLEIDTCEQERKAGRSKR